MHRETYRMTRKCSLCHQVNTKPYIPTTQSTKEAIKKKVPKSIIGPSKVFDEVFEMSQLKAGSDLPRDQRQVKYFRIQLREPKNEDEVRELPSGLPLCNIFGTP